MRRIMLVVLLVSGSFSFLGCGKIGKKVDNLAIQVYESIGADDAEVRAKSVNGGKVKEKHVDFSGSGSMGTIIDPGKGGVNVRSEPSKQGRIIDVISGGTPIYETGHKKDGWVEIVLSNDRIGWVYGKLLKYGNIRKNSREEKSAEGFIQDSSKAKDYDISAGEKYPPNEGPLITSQDEEKAAPGKDSDLSLDERQIEEEAFFSEQEKEIPSNQVGDQVPASASSETEETGRTEVGVPVSDQDGKKDDKEILAPTMPSMPIMNPAKDKIPEAMSKGNWI